MRILINGKPVATLTTRQERDLRVAKAADSIEGSVLTAEEATASYIRRTRFLFVALGTIGLVLMLGMAIGVTLDEGVNQSDRLVGQVGGIVTSALLVTFLWFMLGYRIRRWTRTLGKRQEGMPSAGTVIRLDAERLAVAAQSFAWPSLALEQVEIAEASSGPDSGTVYIIERLSLAAPGGAIVLDKAMIGNGARIVDNVWRRLYVPHRA